MFDQLRFDYLSCYGHPHLETPHLDRLAARGVRFARAYAQSTICGASRMSFYTGRYVHSHGAAWNNFPLKAGEVTLGDHLRDAGMDAFLVGKTHMKADARGMARLGLQPDSVIGARVAECGFDVVVRDDGLWAEGPGGFYDQKRSPYNAFLKEQGYGGDNPWHDHANSGIGDDDDVASGWLMQNAALPANVEEPHSETPWLTDQAIAFMEARGEASPPWLCHLSYIKPHWPYIVPAPYHALYGHNHIQACVRHGQERDDPHPVYGAFMAGPVAQAFQRDEVRNAVIPAYMGLIKQCDDQMGRLFAWMEDAGRMDDTMIVVTSDHGDYLGDHWLGEKDLFHDCSVRLPLIIYDPSSEADAARGSVCEDLVESIDLAATFVEAAGADVPDHVIEGRSLLPMLHGNEAGNGREFVVSEYDYSQTPHAAKLGVQPRDARLFMICDKRWKFIHAEGGFRPMLFDLEADQGECHDLGGAGGHDETIVLMYDRLARWARRMSQRTTISDKDILQRRGGAPDKGVLLGLYDGSEIDEKWQVKYRGKAAGRYVPDQE